MASDSSQFLSETNLEMLTLLIEHYPLQYASIGSFLWMGMVAFEEVLMEPTASMTSSEL